MAGDREHKVVVIGRHDFHIGTEKAPERGQFFDSLRVGAFWRRQNAPAIDEQFREAGVRTGIFRSCDRMRRYETHVLGQVRGHVAHDRTLDRADIRDNCAGGKMWADLFCDRTAGADGNAHDDEIGAFDGGGIAFHHLVGEAELGNAPARFWRARRRDNRTRCALRAGRARN